MYALQPFVTTVVYKAVLCAQIIYLGKRRPLRLGLGQGGAGAVKNLAALPHVFLLVMATINAADK